MHFIFAIGCSKLGGKIKEWTKEQWEEGRKATPEAIAKMILEAYKLGSQEEVQDAIKDVFGPIFEAML